MSPELSPELSIIIVSHHSREWLAQCLESLRANRDVALEIIVVENGSADGSAELVRGEFPEARLICNREPQGFAANNQLGAQAATAPVLLFLNPDTRVPPGSLRAMLAMIARHPECGVFGSRLLDSQGEVERSMGRFPTLTSISLDRLLEHLRFLQPLLERHAQRHYLGYEAPRYVDWVTGACLWIRREALERAGGWDGANFFMYYEDVDLCFRVRRAGYKILFAPQSALFHYRNKAPLDPGRRKALMRRGLAAFARQHYSPLRRRLYQTFLRLPDLK
jgi:GT2 family glycosyltransferase